MTEKKKARRRLPNPLPVVRVKPSPYQPGKAELESDMAIKTTPERLARALGRKVDLRLDDDA